jgi:hypothetical protein
MRSVLRRIPSPPPSGKSPPLTRSVISHGKRGHVSVIPLATVKPLLPVAVTPPIHIGRPRRPPRRLIIHVVAVFHRAAASLSGALSSAAPPYPRRGRRRPQHRRILVAAPVLRYTSGTKSTPYSSTPGCWSTTATKSMPYSSPLCYS